MILFRNTFLLLTALLVLSQCESVIDSNTPDSGTLNLDRYVAVGNSLTAGYADNALYLEGQLVSYPNLLSQQFQKVGGGNFKQPLVDAGPGSDANGNARLVLGLSNGNLGPMPAAAQGQNIFDDRFTEPVQNLGVPGARVFHIPLEGFGNTQAGAGNFNPFYTRFKSSANASLLQDAVSQNPTFFSLWIGNNDVLGYGTSGGVGTINGISDIDITPLSVFTDAITATVQALVSTGADGVILNIPDITSIPFFTTVPWDAVELTATQASNFRSQLSSAGVPSAYIPNYQAGFNGFLIVDPDLDDRPEQFRFRLATAEDHILLTVPQDSLQPAPLGPGWGTTVPIPDQYTLRAPQAANVAEATAQFNNVIENLASEHNLVFVDVNALLVGVKEQGGINFDGMTLTLDFVSGGIFSLDGVHLTDRGNAIVANYIIESLNNAFGAAIPVFNIGDFKGVRFPG